MKPKLLLDENLPVQLRNYFSDEVSVFTVRYMGWSALDDADLLAVMSGESFDFLITVDQRLHTQHDLNRYPFQVITLLIVSNRLPDLLPFVDKIEALIQAHFIDKHHTINR